MTKQHTISTGISKRWIYGVGCAAAVLGQLSAPQCYAAEGSETATSPETEERISTLYFRNGDRIHGELISVTPDGSTMHWQLDGSNSVLGVSRDSVHELVISSSVPPIVEKSDGDDNEPDHEANDADSESVDEPAAHDEAQPVAQEIQSTTGIVHLTNGNEVIGSVNDLTDQTLGITTRSGSVFSINREMVRSISLIPGDVVLLDGPGSKSDWSGRTEGWSFAGGTLSSNQGNQITRPIGDAEKIRVSCMLTTSPNTYNLSFSAFTSDPSNRGDKGYYDMRIAQGWMEVSKVDRRRKNDVLIRPANGHTSLGRLTDTPVISGRENVRVDLYFDRSSGIIAAYFDGEQVARWRDPGGLDTYGESFGITMNGRGRSVADDLRITRWNGVLPEDQYHSDDAGAEVIMTNGDRIAGEVVSINDNQLAVTSDTFGDIKVAPIRVSHLRLKHNDRWNQARKMPLDVTTTFPDGAVMRFALHSVVDGIATVESQNFGTSTIPMDDIRSLRFHHIGEQDVAPSGDTNLRTLDPMELFDGRW